MPIRKTTRNRTRRKELPRICEKCGTQNGPRVKTCSECNSNRFAPGFVLRLRKVNRNFYVQVTRPYEDDGQKNNRITLYKWWPGGRSTLNINTADQWESIKGIIEIDLAPFLKWKTRKQITNDLKELANDEGKAEKKMTNLVQQDPTFFSKVLKGIDLGKISKGDPEKVGDALGEIASIYVQADDSLRKSIKKVIEKLPAQGQRAIDELSSLMESLTLHQITAVTSEVKRRAGLLTTFKERALDDRTYEIQGDRSIHRLLEQAMWIVDERYWIMHSNATLRTVIGKELAKKDKQFEKKRPDFVCGAVDKKLIIIELKRPSHTLNIEDLNQLEQYVLIGQEYDDTYSSFEAILVGKKADEDLRRVLKLRGGKFKVSTFTQLIEDTERRYAEYLKHLNKSAS